MKFFRVFLAAALFPVFSGTPLPAQGPHSVAEQYLFAAANVERVQRGLSPLHWDDGLYRAAQYHSREMLSRASISHQYPGELGLVARARQAGVRFSSISENVAQAANAVRIQDAWMNSPDHRENILDPETDAIGISVLRRNGQLFAVEDFSRTVDNLTFDEQESTVGSLLTSVAPLTLLPEPGDARRTCAMDTGYAGARKPWFVMRYTAGNLTRLPETLKSKLATGKYHEAAVGACAPREGQTFSYFNIAVLLYP